MRNHVEYQPANRSSVAWIPLPCMSVETPQRGWRAVKVVGKKTPEHISVDMTAMPDYQSDAMCRTLIGCISRLFEDPAVRADYERWKQQRQAKGANT